MSVVYTKPFSHRRREMLNTLNRLEMIRVYGDILTDREKANLYNLDETFRKVVRGKIRETLTKKEYKESFLLRLNKNDFSVKVLSDKINHLYKIMNELVRILDTGQPAPRLAEAVRVRFESFSDLFEEDMKADIVACIPEKEIIESYVHWLRGSSRGSRVEYKEDGRLFFYYSLSASMNINESEARFDNEEAIITDFKSKNHVNGLKQFIEGIEKISIWSDRVKFENISLLKLINVLDVNVLLTDLNKVGRRIPSVLANQVIRLNMEDFEASVLILSGIEEIARTIEIKNKREALERERMQETSDRESRENREAEARRDRREEPSERPRATLSLDDLLSVSTTNSETTTAEEPQNGEAVLNNIRSIEELFGEGGLPF